MDASPDSIRVVGESDLLEIAGVARSTWNNWAKKKVLIPPDSAVFGEREVLEACVVAMLIRALELRRVKALWPADGGRVLEEVVRVGTEANCFVVVDLHTWETTVVHDSSELMDAITGAHGHPRGYTVVELGHVVADARNAFWKRALPASELARDSRRKAGRGRAKGTAEPG